MMESQPEREARSAGSSAATADLKKLSHPTSIVLVKRADGAEPQPWRSGDPLPITGTAGFGATTVTITVTIPYEANRSNFNLYIGQNNNSPSTTTQPIASSAGQPVGNALGTTVNYTANQAFTIQLTYLRSTGNTVTLAYTIAAASVTNGSNVSFVLA